MRLRAGALVVFAVVLAGATARAQTTTGARVATADQIPAPAADEAEKPWSILVSASAYLVPDSRDYVQPTVAADRGWLHLEARFNYEDVDTGSLWFGYNVSVGDGVTLEITPMVAAVFGNTSGIAPGYKGSLGWRTLELYSEGEYVFDTDGLAESFLYTWSELAWTPVDWCRLGLVFQHTMLYQTDSEVQRGFLVGFSYKRADITAYVFDPDATRPTVVIGVGLGF